MTVSSLLDRRFLIICFAGALVAYIAKLLGTSDLWRIVAFGLFLSALALSRLKQIAEEPDRTFLLKLLLIAVGIRILVAVILNAMPALLEPDGIGYSEVRAYC